MSVKDEDGRSINSGDYITFSYGIPPTSVLAMVNTYKGELHIQCLDPENTTPKSESLSNLMQWYQVWRAPRERVAAFNTKQRNSTPKGPTP